jgi:nucleotide-binding universal stress UspA family protein
LTQRNDFAASLAYDIHAARVVEGRKERMSMDFRTILAVTGIEEDDRDIEIAASLCEEADAHLSVLVVALAAPPPIGEYAAVVSDAWLEERQADEAQLKARAAAVSRLVARTRSADVTGAYTEIAWTDEAIGRRARCSDIAVAGPASLSGGTLGNRLVEGVLFFSGKPLLLVPEGSRPTLRPKRVAVAWDSRVEAARAVGEARSLLAAADEVRLVLVDPVADEFHQGVEPGADAAAWLARHGARVTVDRLPSEGRPVAEIIGRHAHDMAAELLVMGGYGHSRLRERIFGGVTRSMLRRPPLPILMAR